MVEVEKQFQDIQDSMIDPSDIEQETNAAGVESPASEVHVESSLPDDAVEASQPSSAQDDASVNEAPAIASDSAVVAELNQTITALNAQVEERTAQYLRIAADFDNFRKRTQKEKEELEQQVKCSTVVELLPVVDNFERARSQIKPQTDSEMAIHKSYQGVYKDFVDRLKRIGVYPMRAEGKEFDPSLHEAVMRQPSDEFPEGTVLEELVRGYLLGERVLRHAMVKVAAPSESESNDSGEQETTDSSEES
jgi:molecular chaperone GrpE